MASAISLGYTGSRELLECWLDEELTLQEIQTRLATGITSRDSVGEGRGSGSARKTDPGADLRRLVYRRSSPGRSIELSQKIDQCLLEQPEIWVERKEQANQYPPILHSLDFKQSENQLILHLSAGENTTGRVDEILKLLDIDPLECVVDRAAIELDNAN